MSAVAAAGAAVQNLEEQVADTLKSVAANLTATNSITYQNDLYRFGALVFILWILRVILLKFLVALGRSSLAERYRITRRPAITGAQLERESVWVYGYFYDTVALFGIYYFGFFHDLPMYEFYSLPLMLFWHATVVEFVYYWFHRALHWPWLYKNYHQYHHKSINTEPTTGLSFEIGERLSYTALFAVAPICSTLMGYQSLTSLALYYIWFDFMNEGGHINFEIMPDWYLRSPLRHIFYSPTFHAVHHTKFKKNYSLFMPWTDVLFSTAVYVDADDNTSLPVTIEQKPDFVLLVHAGYMTSVLYSRVVHPFGFEAFFQSCKNKYSHSNWMFLMYPYLWLLNIFINIFTKPGYHNEETFQITPYPDFDDYNRKKVFTGSTWVVQNLAAQYILPSFKNIINRRIESAIVDAAQQGIQTVVLGNFNKAEWMNHGGTDIVKNVGHKLGKTVISHGDTLSAAVIFQYSVQLKNQGYWSKGVFITGSTSKIGRAVVLSLARLGVPVKMFTQCKPRFDEIANELTDPVQRSCLKFCTSLKEGADCDFWLTGKMIPYGTELLDAIPDNATIVNFSVPDPLTQTLLNTRPDLLHLDSGLLFFDKQLAHPNFTWLLPEGHIYACLAGGIVHSVLGIDKHEVGAVEVEAMQVYWDAAIKLGFKIPEPTSFYNPVQIPPPKNVYANASLLNNL
eukprot:TRINITY_DN65_c0_g1_i1.p1 TRINITY_DN65_c0_g1~~TRINITY_DN65_c0_g1_i1.p1  ORF type:complete len:681 (-),score=284.58 TRINITY_DN65_c0_g1_i1:65-2107(-)